MGRRQCRGIDGRSSPAGTWSRAERASTKLVEPLSVAFGERLRTTTYLSPTPNLPVKLPNVLSSDNNRRGQARDSSTAIRSLVLNIMYVIGKLGRPPAADALDGSSPSPRPGRIRHAFGYSVHNSIATVASTSSPLCRVHSTRAITTSFQLAESGTAATVWTRVSFRAQLPRSRVPDRSPRPPADTANHLTTRRATRPTSTRPVTS